MENSDHFTEMTSSNPEEAMQITAGGIIRAAEANTIPPENILRIGSGTVYNVSTFYAVPKISELHIFSQGRGVNFEIMDCLGFVYSGGVISSSEITIHAVVFIQSGGAAYDMVLAINGGLSVVGGYASGVTTLTGWDNGIRVNSSGIALDIEVRNGGSLTVELYGSSYYNIIWGGAFMDVSYNGFARYNLISGGLLTVGASGVVHDNCIGWGGSGANWGYMSATRVYSGGHLHMYTSGIASDTIVYSGGSIVFHGGFANEVVVSQGGIIDMRECGHVKELDLMGTLIMPTLDDVNIIYSRGASPHMEILTSNLILDFHVSSGGLMRIGGGATVEGTIVSSGGVIHNSGNENTYGTNILSGGLVRVSSGSMRYTTVYSGGLMQVGNATISGTLVSGGTVELDHPNANSWNTTIYDNYMVVWSGARASNTVISGGTLFVMNGKSYNTSVQSILKR